MAQIHWLDAVSGDFETAADWSTDSVPGAGDAAILDAAGSPYTVTASTSETVGSIQTTVNATLTIDSGTFHTMGGTGAGANAGAIIVENRGKFRVGGTFMNTGAITLVGGPAFQIIVGAVTLDGGGIVSLRGGRIEGIGARPVLTNVDNTISGEGLIGLSSTFNEDLTVINETRGVIDANVAKSDIDIADTRRVTNAGLMEATDNGVLTILTPIVQNWGGTIAAISGGTVYLYGPSISGGAVSASGAGSRVVLDDSTTITGAGISTAAGGEIDILHFSTVTTHGDVANEGLIEVNASGGGGAMPTLVLHGGASLIGGGTVTLIGGTIEGAAGALILTNVDNTIEGGGEIEGASSTLINRAAGSILATGGAVITLATKAVNNAGLVQAIAGALVIDGAIKNSGTAEAQGGGTITFGGQVTGAGKFRLDGGTLDFTSSFNGRVFFYSGPTNVLELGQSQTFTGSLQNFSRTGRSTLDLADIGFVSADEATFSGTATGGTLTVTDGTHTASITLVGDYLTSTFTASGDGHNGSDIVANAAQSAASAHRLLAAAAALGGGSAGPITATHETLRDPPTMLARPGTMIA